MIEILRKIITTRPTSDLHEIECMHTNNLSRFSALLEGSPQNLAYYPPVLVAPTSFQGLNLPIRVAPDCEVSRHIKLNSPIVQQQALTLLHCAVILNKINFVKLLIDYGADIYLKNADGNDAIALAEMLEDKTIVNFLKEKQREEKEKLKKLFTETLRNMHTTTGNLRHRYGQPQKTPYSIADKLCIEIWSLLTDQRLCDKYLGD